MSQQQGVKSVLQPAPRQASLDARIPITGAGAQAAAPASGSGAPPALCACAPPPVRTPIAISRLKEKAQTLPFNSLLSGHPGNPGTLRALIHRPVFLEGEQPRDEQATWLRGTCWGGQVRSRNEAVLPTSQGSSDFFKVLGVLFSFVLFLPQIITLITDRVRPFLCSPQAGDFGRALPLTGELWASTHGLFTACTILLRLLKHFLSGEVCSFRPVLIPFPYSHP